MPADPRFLPRMRLRGERSGGAIAIVESTAPPRWAGPPLHHHAFDEAFYVLDGQLTFQLGDQLHRGAAGDLAFARGGEIHTLANHTDQPARYLLTITPAGFEAYFDRLAAQAAGIEAPPDSDPPYAETIVVGPTIDPDVDAATLATLPDVASEPGS